MLMLLWFTSDLSTGIARLGLGELDVRRLRRRTFRPRLEGLAQLGFHRLGIEVAGDAEDDVVGMDVLLMPVEQILHG